jgi:MoxR-like ATPase
MSTNSKTIFLPGQTTIMTEYTTKKYDPKNLSDSIDVGKKISDGLAKVIRGRKDTIKFIVTALLADGHALLEDYPGSGKTTLAKTLGRLISKDKSDSPTEILPFRRIQFTPDMLPGDVLGVNVFDPKNGSFSFLHGPIFAHIVLADEINRTGPKVQAAFLECMAEKQVTIDNHTHPLHPLFFVLGTQNPLDFAGTYPLPLVQLDRFLLKIPMTYVDSATENEILADHVNIQHSTNHCDPVVSVSDIMRARADVKNIYVAPVLREAIVGILQATRSHPLLEFGASTRSGLMLQAALQAHALIEGRNYCTEDDLKTMLPYVLLHRLRFRSSGSSSTQILNEIAAPFLEKAISAGLTH